MMNKASEEKTKELERKLEASEKESKDLKNRLTDHEERLETAELRLKERDRVEEVFLQGGKITGTTSGTVGVETSHSHNLARNPSFVFLTPTSEGTIWKSSTSDANKIYVTADTSSVTFDAYCIQ